MGVAKIQESSSRRGRGLGVEEKCADFGLRRSGDDRGKNCANGVDRSVERGLGEVATGSHAMVTAGTGAGVCLRQVRGVRPYRKAHVTGDKHELSRRPCGCILEEVMDLPKKVLGRVGLSGCELVEGSQHSGVDGARIIQKYADDLLDKLNLRGSERGRNVLRDAFNVGAVSDRLAYRGSRGIWELLKLYLRIVKFNLRIVNLYLRIFFFNLRIGLKLRIPRF